MNSTGPGTHANWLPVYAVLVGVVLVIVDRFDIMSGVAWWQLPIAGVVAAVVAVMMTLIQEGIRGGRGWGRVLAHRVVTMLSAAAWATWADLVGWSGPVILAAAIGVVSLSAMGLVCQSPVADGRPVAASAAAADGDISPKTPAGPTYQTVIRSVTKMPAVVTSWEPWGDPKDGLRLFVSLPAEQGVTAADLAPKTANLGAGARLPRGCNVRVLDSDLQGVVIVDVMLRNCLMDKTAAYAEPTTPASITDDFPILTTPRGEILSICLRIYSMIIGGTTGSGKTTLLHRIIMWLARCTDALIWVVDLNGGGVADPWITPWVEGRASQPIVDWVARSEEEAAVLVAVARAVAVDRKSNQEARRRKRDANDTVLPVDDRMPAIVVMTDEGGEVRQATSLFGQLAAQGISRLAQIGRAEGVRTIMSVLRGTADLADKGLRVVSALRLCLRMDEHDEYVHVLGANPGKTELEGAQGAGFLRTATISRPVLGRTVNVDLAGIDRHAVACGDLRPALDDYGLRAAARVTPKDVIGGREPAIEHLRHPAMKDAARGRAYLGRWDRYRAGMDVEADEDQTAPSAALSGTGTTALDAWCAQDVAPVATATPVAAPAQVVPVTAGNVIPLFGERATRPTPEPVTPAVPTAREQILALVRASGVEGVAAAEMEREVHAVRSRVMDLIKELRERGEIERNDYGLYVLARGVSRGAGG